MEAPLAASSFALQWPGASPQPIVFSLADYKIMQALLAVPGSPSAAQVCDERSDRLKPTQININVESGGPVDVASLLTIL